MLRALKNLILPSDNLPDRWLDTYLDHYRYTPDIRTLEMGKHWWLFEYGECMQAHREHRDFMEDKIEFWGAAFTQFSNLVMYKKDLGPFTYPVAIGQMPKPPGLWFKTDSSEPLTSNLKRVDRARHPFNTIGQPARVKGELYLVEGVESFLKLDIMRENGVSFKRVRMNILFPYTKSTWDEKTGCFVSEEFMEETPAWMYVGIRKYWDNILDNGYSSRLVHKFQSTPRSRADQALGDYYFYSKLETLEDADRIDTKYLKL